MTNNKLTKNFRFKQFDIWGGSSGMPVSTDGVMLGAWAKLNTQGHILDIGTGTGLLALMAAQRYPDINITAIDIDHYAIQAAKKNCSMSPWADRISVLQQDVTVYHVTNKFSGIICNPPYFNSGATAQTSQRATARHTTQLKHQQLLERCFALTADNGVANFILPITESSSFIDLARSCGWFVKHSCRVSPTEKKSATRHLLHCTKVPGESSEDQLTIQINGQYSDKFIALTRDFYLKM